MKDRYRPMYGDPVSFWFEWFAWRPVWTHDRGWVWLRVVLRRKIAKHAHLDGGRDFWPQYVVKK
jgi:hypothetical protein